MKELFVMNASCNFKAASERIIVIAGTQTVTLDITTNYNNNNYIHYVLFDATKRDISIYFHSVSAKQSREFGILDKMQNIADC